MANGNGTKWLIWMAGIIATAVIFVAIPTMAKGIIDNDRMARERDTNQVKETSAVKADIREIKTDIKYMREDMMEQKVMTRKILDKLG